ncbi:hypothetical protein [Pedobacter sp. KBW06]|uniref:hypothetical protein n=1 Tax=Pedobacter sp. KBW06 TaxID=2153359 RepID=UPI000F5909E6|nr:hypothetical protein [Pedobacter sp. KBW06]
MLPLKEAKRLNRNELKGITGGVKNFNCPMFCSHYVEGAETIGCPDGQLCDRYPCGINDVGYRCGAA